MAPRDVEGHYVSIRASQKLVAPVWWLHVIRHENYLRAAGVGLQARFGV